MKQSEFLFKMPFRMYTSRDWEIVKKIEQKNIEHDTDVPLEAPPFAIGYESIFIDEIIGWYTGFSYPRSIEDVRENGPDTTVVSVKGGREISCAWDTKEFVKRYDAHIEKIKEFQAELLKKEYEEKSGIIRKALEENLTEVVNSYKEQGLNLSMDDIEKSI